MQKAKRGEVFGITEDAPKSQDEATKAQRNLPAMSEAEAKAEIHMEDKVVKDKEEEKK